MKRVVQLLIHPKNDAYVLMWCDHKQMAHRDLEIGYAAIHVNGNKYYFLHGFQENKEH